MFNCCCQIYVFNIPATNSIFLWWYSVHYSPPFAPEGGTLGNRTIFYAFVDMRS